MHKCPGCGSELQTESINERGYVKSLDQAYCQSCFRLRHYRDFKRVKANVNDGDTLDFISRFEGHIFWVVDVLRLSQSLHHGLIRSLKNKSIVLVVNKRDLLPKSVHDKKLKQSILRLLKGMSVELSEIVIVSANKPQSLEPLYPYLDDAPCAFVGCINAGKSSLLNALLGKDELSVSPVASTTADVIRIDNDEYEVYDTPGLVHESKLPEKFTDDLLVLLSPQKTIKPDIFQIYEKQAIVLGNLGAIIIDPVKEVVVVSYVPFKAKRVKPERVEANLDVAEDFKILNPVYRKRKWPVKSSRIDLEIFDVGFISIQGPLKSLETIVDEAAEVILREAII